MSLITGIRLTVGPFAYKNRRVEHVAFELPDNQQVLLTATATDADGQAVADPVTWSVDDPNIVGLAGATDDTVVAISGVPGTATVSAADAFGLVATFEITVVPGPPVALTITAGVPEPEQPQP